MKNLLHGTSAMDIVILEPESLFLQVMFLFNCGQTFGVYCTREKGYVKVNFRHFSSKHIRHIEHLNLELNILALDGYINNRPNHLLFRTILNYLLNLHTFLIAFIASESL